MVMQRYRSALFRRLVRRFTKVRQKSTESLHLIDFLRGEPALHEVRDLRA